MERDREGTIVFRQSWCSGRSYVIKRLLGNLVRKKPFLMQDLLYFHFVIKATNIFQVETQTQAVVFFQNEPSFEFSSTLTHTCALQESMCLCKALHHCTAGIHSPPSLIILLAVILWMEIADPTPVIWLKGKASAGNLQECSHDSPGCCLFIGCLMYYSGWMENRGETHWWCWWVS